MRTQVTILGWLYIALHAVHMLAGLFVLVVFVGIGGLAAAAGGHGGLPALPILGGIGLLVFLLLTIVSVPGLLAGVGLLRFAPGARILAIVISILDLFAFPHGTILGIYGPIVLLNPETTALFEGRRY